MPIANVGAVPDVVTNSLISVDWGNAIGGATRGRVVQRFNSLAERDASIAAPVSGMLCYVLATDLFYGYRTATGWTTLIGGPRDTAQAFVYRAGGYSITTTLVPIVFDTIVSDPLGLYNTGTGRFTVATAGRYLLTAGYQAYSASSQICDIHALHNGVSAFLGASVQTTGFLHAFISARVACAAGDTVSIGAVLSGTPITATPGANVTYCNLDYLGP
jgi:hypothetical protein